MSALGLSLILTPVCERWAVRWRCLDLPAPRKVHSRPTPLLGGVAVYLAFTAAIVVFLRPVVHAQMTLLLAGAAAFGIIGMVDDLRGVGPWKLAAEGAVVVAIVWLGGFRVNLPWPYLGEILAALWIVGVANAMNCLDCTDGIAAGVAAISGVALTLLAVLANRWGVAVATVAVAGAALGFLRYNLPPARIFLGDAGSLMLGFLLAALGAELSGPRASLPAGIAPALVLTIPVYDFLLVHIRRYRDGMRNPIRILTSTGKDHLPHRLLDGGLSHRQAVLWVYGITLLSGAGAVMLDLWASLPTSMLMMSFAMASVIVGWIAWIALDGRAGNSRELPVEEEGTIAPSEAISKTS